MSNKEILFSEIKKVVSLFKFDEITSERNKTLQSLIDFIHLKIDN